MIVIKVENQLLTIQEPKNFDFFVTGSQNFVSMQFILDEKWNDLRVFAQFQQDGVSPVNVYLDANNRVYLPPNIVAGNCKLMLFGTGGETIGTTNYLIFRVTNNGFIPDAQSTEISQSLYAQLVERVEETFSVRDEVLLAKDYADNCATEANQSAQIATQQAESASISKTASETAQNVTESAKNIAVEAKNICGVSKRCSGRSKNCLRNGSKHI